MLITIILFGVCIGLVQFLIAANIAKFGAKKTVLLTLSWGILLATVNFLIINLSVPETMIHKSLSSSSGILVFAFFALTVSILLRRQKIACLVINIFSCALYWVLLVFGESLSVKLGRNAAVNMWFPTLLFIYLTITFYLVHKLMEMHKQQ